MDAPVFGLITPAITTLLPTVSPGVLAEVVTVTVVPLSLIAVIGVSTVGNAQVEGSAVVHAGAVVGASPAGHPESPSLAR